MRGIEASWVITGEPGRAPIADGAVVLDDQARIVAVGPAPSVRAAHAGVSFQRESAILLPGLVNAHVHLELSALRGQTRSGGGFGPWVTGMMARRDAVAPEHDDESIDAAISELLRAGTAAIGEVTNSLRTVALLAGAPLLGRVFHEVFGLSKSAGEAMRAQANTVRAALSAWPLQLGYALAPHSLYALHPDIARELVDAARASGARTSLHLAEHAAETAFLRDGSGPFVEFLAQRGMQRGDFVPPGASPVSYAEALGVLSPAVLAVHLCATTRAELARVKALGAFAVLCPRSNLFIELKLPPLYDVLEVGLTPALGTDSLASNTTLDVLAEAAALADRFPQADRGMLISMATYHGAEALGLSHRVGALAVGRSPGVLAFDLAQPVADPLRYLLRAPPPARRVLARPRLPTAGEALEDRP
jgi:aminodeoxyfutalosine deaminase